MNKLHFVEITPGKLVKVRIRDADDWAFIPNDLPNTWEMPNTIWQLLVQAREELGRLDGVGRHMPNYELLLRPLQQREALRSSSLEGTYATPEQLLLFEMDPREPKSSTDPVNAWLEVFNYRKALNTGQNLLDKIPISNRLIKELHKELLSRVRGQHRDPGNFRKSLVHIGSDRRFIPPPPHDAVRCLNELEKYINIESNIDPLVFCFIVHYQFEAIHPFLDGNGRVGRLLLSLMIYKLCNLTSPWLYLSAFFEKYKDEYIDGLFDVSAKADWEKWLSFCLRATIAQAKDSVTRLDKLVALREKYLNLITNRGGNIRLHTLIESLFKAPIITVPQASNILNITYPTAKSDIKVLIQLKILEKSTMRQKSKVFFAPEIMNIAYSDEI